MNLLEEYNKRLLQDATSTKQSPKFIPGDTIKVFIKIIDGNTERIQAFEGVCIARHNNSISSTFTVRKISYNIGVEKTLPLHSPIIDRIEVLKRGKVRRAKLYYLRNLRGKAARIKEKRDVRTVNSVKSSVATS